MVHLYQEEMLKQRFFGSLLVARDVNPGGIMRMLSRFRTNCAELNGHINFKTLKLILECDEENLSIADEVLRELCVEAGDNGFDVHIDAMGEDAVDAAMEALSAVRSAGYKKNALILAHDEVSGQQELSDSCYHLDISESVSTLPPDNDWLCIEGAKSVEEAVDMLTVNAALLLGISGEFGSIVKSKHADFVIFDENPLECKTLAEFKKLHSVMTVIDGNVVYDAEEDDMSQWFAMLTEQQY
jgi:N-acyl-D-aspartate/D-glutamate deacylase